VPREVSQLERLKAQLQALSATLPELSQRIQARAEALGESGGSIAALRDVDPEGRRLAAFSAYLDHYSTSDGGTLGPLDLRGLLEQAVALAGGELAGKAQVTTSYQPAPLVRGSSRQLGQVFVSLLINAAQAIPPGAVGAHVVVELETSEQGWARVAIADTGEGIAADVLPRIFEPRFSTKRGAGMGIGLAVVREIVDGLGGRISVESEPGFGTLFVIELPAAELSSAP
jgi:signal transduction histidine kinase